MDEKKGTINTPPSTGEYQQVFATLLKWDKASRFNLGAALFGSLIPVEIMAHDSEEAEEVFAKYAAAVVADLTGYLAERRNHAAELFKKPMTPCIFCGFPLPCDADTVAICPDCATGKCDPDEARKRLEVIKGEQHTACDCPICSIRNKFLQAVRNNTTQPTEA